MKLNNFFDKPRQKKANQKIVTVVNEVKEKALEEKVNYLQDQLNTLNEIKNENIELSKQMQLIKSELGETIERERGLLDLSLIHI